MYGDLGDVPVVKSERLDEIAITEVISCTAHCCHSRLKALRDSSMALLVFITP